MLSIEIKYENEVIFIGFISIKNKWTQNSSVYIRLYREWN